MGKCILCEKETEGKVCEKCQRDYELKLNENEENEQKSLDILAEKHDTSGIECLLHTLSALCVFPIILLVNSGDFIEISFVVASLIFFEIFAGIIRWIRLAVNELIEIKAKMK